MDWQVIILTLGASLITGAVSLIGNIVVTKANLKRTLLENREESKKEFMKNRFEAYELILHNLNYLERNTDKENILKESEIEQVWLNHYPYCSKEMNHHLYMFTKYFDRKDKSHIDLSISHMREQIKKDLDEYYGVKDKKLK